jgi:hypothetical protein
VEKISSIAENMMLPPSMSNKEKVISGGSNRNMRLITLSKDNCDPW